MNNSSRYRHIPFLFTLVFCVGCNSQPDKVTQELSVPSDTSPAAQADSDMEVPRSPEHELDSDELLGLRLSLNDTSKGWARLFDGYTYFGLQMAGDTMWQIEDQSISASSGAQGLICTTMPWLDYELTLEFKAGEDTNSGIFLRTPLFPTDPASDCYELNIAPLDNPFPTGSLVNREKVDTALLNQFDHQAWHRYDIRVQSGNIVVALDGEAVLRYEDPNPLPAGLIGFQHNQGKIAFRDIRVRPLGLSTLLSSSVDDHWIKHPQLEGEFQMTEDGMHVTGGRGQLETKAQFADFTLLAKVRTNAADLNSGIFFRCIPGDQMMGYECQISNAIKDANPLFPADCGTGGFFRRQDARIVAASDQDWFSMLLVAHGPTMATWVNGIQVSEWTDQRETHENPRKGLRLEPGTLMIQAHDPTTDIHIGELSIASQTP